MIQIIFFHGDALQAQPDVPVTLHAREKSIRQHIAELCLSKLLLNIVRVSFRNSKILIFSTCCLEGGIDGFCQLFLAD